MRALRSSLTGEYRIIRELGRGGQAAVFQADEIALHRMVALKVLAPGSITGERQIELFRREAQTIANLKHPNIVTVYSVRQVDDLHFFVMQFIEGRSLAAILADRGPMPLTAVRAVAFQVGSALQYAHRRSVVHRDVKPGNVLFDEDGNAILTDFGIAKDTANTSITVTGSMMGTAAYMSPEQCHQMPVTWASDQYSLGILLYEMLTGHVPFEGAPFSVMQGHTDREVPPVRASRVDCPVEMEWAVLRMLAKQPADRWPSFPDALAALGAGPLGRDDPIRAELKRLARSSGPLEPVVDAKPRLTIRGPDQLEVGESATFQTYAIIGSDATAQKVSAAWRSRNESVAVFDDPTGTLRGIGVGSTVISAETEHGPVETTIEVGPAVPRELTFSLARPTLTVGESVRLTADVRDRRGAALDVRVLWSVGDPTVASVDEAGVLTARAAGSTPITAKVPGVAAERLLFVQEAAAARIEIDGAESPLWSGAVQTLGARVFDESGVRLDGRIVEWSSSDERVVTVDRFGTVRGKGPGRAWIAAHQGEARARIEYVVTAPAASVAMASTSAPLREVVLPTLEPGGLALATAHVASAPAASAPVAAAPSEPADARSAAEPSGSQGSTDDDAAAWARLRERIEAESDAATGRSRSSLRAGRFLWIAVPAVLLLSILIWRAVGRRSTSASNDPASFMAPAAIEAVASRGYQFGRTVELQEFVDSPADTSVVVSDGRLLFRPGSRAYAPREWNVESANFVVHADVRFEPIVDSRVGGIILRTAGTSNYFLQLASPPAGSFTLLKGLTPLLAPTKDAALTESTVLVDLVVLDRRVQLFLNGVPRAESAELDEALSGAIGVFVGSKGGVSFDNVMVADLVRR